MPMMNFTKIEIVDDHPVRPSVDHSEFVIHKLLDSTSPNPSAFDVYADAHSGGANTAMGDGSVVLSDPVTPFRVPDPVTVAGGDIEGFKPLFAFTSPDLL
jgi:prepilin-type processing-associated H-X9-DG protein